MMPVSGSGPAEVVETREIVEESEKIQSLRKKLEKHLDAKKNSLTPERISKSLVQIKEWIATHASNRVGLGSIGPLFRKNKDSAPPSAAIHAKMKEITKRFQKEAVKE
jgi:hypothetical protein